MMSSCNLKKDLGFIHIPKTAGVSIKSTGIFKGDFEHKTARDVPNIGDFFSFALTRNPYDKLLSSYLFMRDSKRSPGRPLTYDVDPKFKGTGYWRNRKLYIKMECKTFSEFIRNFSNSSVIDRIHFGLTQYEYVFSNKGDKLVDFVGRFENITEDWKKFQLLAGFSEEDFISLPRKNTNYEGHIIDFRNFYNDEIADIVYRKFFIDFKTFDYDRMSYKNV